MKTTEAYTVEHGEQINKDLDRLVRKKKFTSLPSQIHEIGKLLGKGEFQGVKIAQYDIPKPHEIYKLRLPNPDTNVGKSNGYRLFYLVLPQDHVVILLAIYYKKEKETLVDTYIDGLIAKCFLNN